MPAASNCQIVCAAAIISRDARICQNFFCVIAAEDAHVCVPDAGGTWLTLVCLVQAEQQRALDAGDTSEAEVWRHRLHHYLDQLFLKDQTAGADYHVLQVCPHVRQCMHR